MRFVSSIKSLKCTSKKLVIIVDSISTVLLEKSFHSIYRLLRQITLISACSGNIAEHGSLGFAFYHIVFKSSNWDITYELISCIAGGRIQVQVVALLHEDTILNPVPIIKQLKSVCRVWMHVKSDTVTVSIRKTSGKLMSQVNWMHGVTNNVRWLIQVFPYSQHRRSMKFSSNSLPPTIWLQTYEFEYDTDSKLIQRRKKQTANDSHDGANENKPISTFRLTLSESEKKARDAVKLPYERLWSWYNLFSFKNYVNY